MVGTFAKVFGVIIAALLFIGGIAAIGFSFALPNLDGVKLMMLGISFCAFAIKVGDELK